MQKAKAPIPRIEFTDEDLDGVYYPHEDVLVITLRISNYDVRRVLVDNGSAVNVIFLNTLRKMDFDPRRIEPANTKLTGFSWEIKVPEGRVTLPVTIGNASRYITTVDEFQVVDSTSPYNVIIGHQWMHDLGIIPSSFHQCMKMVIQEEVETIRGDQREARECSCSAL